MYWILNTRIEGSLFDLSLPFDTFVVDAKWTAQANRPLIAGSLHRVMVLQRCIHDETLEV